MSDPSNTEDEPLPETKPNFVAIAAMFMAFALLMLAALGWPRGEFVLVVGKPGDSPSHIFSIIDQAGGSFVAGSNYAWLAVAYSPAPDFAARLMRSGAFLVLDHSLASSCLERTTP